MDLLTVIKEFKEGKSFLQGSANTNQGGLDFSELNLLGVDRLTFWPILSSDFWFEVEQVISGPSPETTARRAGIVKERVDCLVFRFAGVVHAL